MNHLKAVALRIVLAALAVLAVGTYLATSARADDIAASFSGTANPNTPWSYGSLDGSTFTLMTNSANACGNSGLPDWSGPGGFPVVVANNTGSSQSCVTWTLPTDTLNLHPTDTAGLDSDVRWTAPASATYVISGTYSALDATTTDDHILLNGVQLGSTININSSSNPSQSFSFTETLTAGDQVDFEVGFGSDGNYFSDSTGLKGSISLATTTTPEPSTIVLALGALLLLPIVRQRLL